jgi:hypothetical protein
MTLKMIKPINETIQNSTSSRWIARFGLAGLALAVTLNVAGCRVDEHNSGEHQDVKIATPFGGLSVKTDDKDVQAGIGMAIYPGAIKVKKLQKDKDGDEHDNGAADVNMNFGSFHLGVKATSFTTPDAPDKVLAFYRKELARYGSVVFCKNGHAIGTPTETQDGLTCDKDKHDKVNVQGIDDDDSEGSLKAGSKLHQHIVAVSTEDGKTKFALVALDLPGHLSIDDKDGSQ